MTQSNSKISFFKTMSKIAVLIMLSLAMFFSCKNKEEKIDDNTLEETATENIDMTPKLEKGCYIYNDNGSMVNFEITKTDNPVEGHLTYSFAEKDKNTGTFSGSINEGKLVGTYTFQSEGLESNRQVAFLLKDNQLIEGYGELNEDGTMFKDLNSVRYSSNMPLSLTDCNKQSAECLFKNGKSYSELKQQCLELATLNTKLNPLKNGEIISRESAYVLFSETNSKAEIFLPSNSKGILLNKSSEGNWAYQNYKLIGWKGYVLQKDGTPIFGGQ